MENREQQALLPREQAFVPFHHKKILGARLPDDHLAASISSLCAMVGLAPHGQVERIRRDQELSKSLLLVKMKTPGGFQYMDMLLVAAIPSWVMGLNLKMIAPAKRPLILALKVEIVEVFYNYFFKTSAAQVSQPIAPPARRLMQTNRKAHRLARPLRDGSTAELADLKAAIQRLEARQDELHEQVRSIRQEQQDVQARIQALTETFEVFQVQADVRLAWLERWRRIATGAGEATVPEAEELASFTLVRDLARLLSAAIERLLEIQGRVDQLEPKPPPRPRRGGRPRRDRS
jgi:FtsZ-binding cell division protein ZapB